jgi:hypothetical protein
MAVVIVRDGDTATITPEAARVMACTGTASFGRLRRIPIDDVTFDSIWASDKPVG